MRPRMQLSESVPVTDSFRAEINQWMIDFFGYEDDAKASIEPIGRAPKFDDANIVIRTPVESEAKPAKQGRKKTQEKVKSETLAELLSSLDSSFSSIRVPEIKGSWLAKDSVRAIKRLGIFIPEPFRLDKFDFNAQKFAGKSRPSIASAYLFGRQSETIEKLKPRFAFAIKAPSLPARVEQARGTPYQFGLSYELRHTEGGKPMPPKTFWAWCWMVIAPDGRIVTPMEMRQNRATIIHRNGKWHGEKFSSAYQYQRGVPSIMVAEPGIDQQEHESFMQSMFCALLTWWVEREDQWSVGVRKDGHRCTFSIDPKHTAAYFADRGVVVNENGQRMKIIHYVSAHTRANGSSVKAHVRGLREFDWNGFHCTVTAPRLNGAVTTTADLSPIPLDPESNEPTLSTSEFAEMLAASEDRGYK